MYTLAFVDNCPCSLRDKKHSGGSSGEDENIARATMATYRETYESLDFNSDERKEGK